MRYRVCAASAMAILAAVGCVADGTSSEPTGGFSLALRQTDPSGDVYRLRGAVLHVSGVMDQDFEPAEDDASLQAELPPGDYQLELTDGWSLERERAGQTQPVEATLLGENPQHFSIATDQVTSLSLRFSVVGQAQVALGTGQLAVSLQVDAATELSPVCALRLVINEVDYNQEGTDSAEFVELYNPGPCEFATTGLLLALRNGVSSPAPVYAQIALDGAGPVIAVGGYLVVGAPSVLAALPANVMGVDLGSVTLQNGNPDGMHLEQAGRVLDAMSYGGAMPGVTETASAPVDGGAGSLGRCPDGSDTDDNSIDFHVQATVSPGLANGCS